MKIEIKDINCGCMLYEKTKSDLIDLGGGIAIFIYKKENKQESGCIQYNDRFNYHGIENALTGKRGRGSFTPKRFIVIQMQ